MNKTESYARVWEENVVIPTYPTGEPDINPMFIEKRVYQGSSGRVYPLPVIDKIYDHKTDQTYRAVFLENEYIRVMVLPELGGRIHRALDKTNGYDFVYYNEVIKPALVGLAGPWISGGIEFNWPQHHRPTTFMPVEYVVRENDDQSKSVLLSEVDRMYGTKGMMTFTVYPGKAYIEIKGRLFNRTPLPQTFLWWANPAVSVNEHTRSIFPPDVHAVMDHGKRGVSRFPIATGVYYKHDYGQGVDISRYQNIPVPTSYMAYHSEFDFVGGYDDRQEAGILHIADHHISPGKKQWTWGCGDFGQAWDRNLTDANGPYIELMTGVFTDNQPDFTWLKPFEEKTFTQVFMPYKKVGQVQNANADIVAGMDLRAQSADVRVYASGVFEHARIVLYAAGNKVYEENVTLSPLSVYQKTVAVGEMKGGKAELAVLDGEGRLLLQCGVSEPALSPMPEPAQALPDPADIRTAEELYLAAVHLEQYRHASYEPDAYYLEALKRDPGDIRSNTGYGMLLLRRGCFTQSEIHFRAAVKRATWKNPNPYDSEPYYGLGLSLLYQDREAEALDAFYKAIWSSAQKEASFYYLAAISCRREAYGQALEFIEQSLVKNSHNLQSRGLKAVILRKLGRFAEARDYCAETLAMDPFANLSSLETDTAAAKASMGSGEARYIEAAIDYMQAGFWKEAVAVLDLCGLQTPMLYYYRAYCMQKTGADGRADLHKAQSASRQLCFPNRLEDIPVLRFAIRQNPADGFAAYYLGNLFYDKKQYAQAGELWETAAALLETLPTVHRNLSLYYYNKRGDAKKALAHMEKAFALDPTDARVFLELDQLRRKTGLSPERRFAEYGKYPQLIDMRDDLTTEYVTLLNLFGRYEQALSMMTQRRFHPWEGGEGKITAQYAVSLKRMAEKALDEGNAEESIALLQRALRFPHTLGEGKLEGAKDNDVYYVLGIACEALGDLEEARRYWHEALQGEDEPSGMMFYNDQPADMILYKGLAYRKLGNEAKARTCFHKLVDYGNTHLFDDVKIDYFAVSLPDLALFDNDLNLQNRIYCTYVAALGYYGLGEYDKAEQGFSQVLALDCAHAGARRFLPLSARQN